METAISAGLPVEIGRIDKELGKLWESSDDTKTRASLINLAIYTEDAASIAVNTEIIAEIAGQHACRAILILGNPGAPESQARAWISAHCHLVGKGGRQICSEQITFQLDGEAAEALPNIVFSHLDSDLPFCFWWRGDFREPLDEKLWMWVDRLIFDSATWADPVGQFELAARISALGDSSVVLCDLNWTRLYSCRFALAGLFDHPAALPCLARLSSVKIRCAPGCRTTAMLLLGWLAAQLGWKLERLLSSSFFVGSDRRHITFEVEETPGPAISFVQLCAEGACFELCRSADSDFFHGKIHAPGFPDSVATLNAGREKLTDVLLAELSRGGRHPLYAKALAVVKPLFPI